METIDKSQNDLLFKEECYKVIGACMAVHRELGNGFLESVYQEALAIEFKQQGIPFIREKVIPVIYKSVALHSVFKADFVCYDSIILELKALSALTGDHSSQVINYLKATGMRVGLLVNFGSSSLKHQRFVL
jgi:GxxExxY protein